MGSGPFNSYQSGLHNVGSFQVSSIPFVSASIPVAPSSSTPPVLEIDFYKVTKFLVVKNEVSVDLADAPVRLGFSENGIKGDNYILLENDESFSADYKVSRIYLMAHTGTATSASVISGLTWIPSSQLKHNWSGSAGVG